MYEYIYNLCYYNFLISKFKYYELTVNYIFAKQLAVTNIERTYVSYE